MSSPTIRFYFDYESPNAYLAWTQLPRLAEKHGYVIDAAPVLYAALLDAHGQLGPGEILAKGRWMTKNLLRKAALAGVPLNPPAFLPFSPLRALRVSLLPLEVSARRSLIDALFQAVWVRSLHVSEPAVVEMIGNEVGLSGADLVAQAQSPEIKSLLRRQTDEAISRGVFGVPSMEVGDELFWGYDDFPYLDSFLAGRDSLDSNKWQEVEPSNPVFLGSEEVSVRERSYLTGGAKQASKRIVSWFRQRRPTATAPGLIACESPARVLSICLALLKNRSLPDRLKCYST